MATERRAYVYAFDRFRACVINRCTEFTIIYSLSIRESRYLWCFCFLIFCIFLNSEQFIFHHRPIANIFIYLLILRKNVRRGRDANENLSVFLSLYLLCFFVQLHVSIKRVTANNYSTDTGRTE